MACALFTNHGCSSGALAASKSIRQAKPFASTLPGMRWTQSCIPTLKQAPPEAESAGHRLLLRAGLVRRVGSGLYAWLPLGERVMQKIEGICRSALRDAGAQEVHLPYLISTSALASSPGLDVEAAWRGANLPELQDAEHRCWAFGADVTPHLLEALGTELASYRSLPRTFFQLRTSWRPDVRPRSGLGGARETRLFEGWVVQGWSDAETAAVSPLQRVWARILDACNLPVRSLVASVSQSQRPTDEVLWISARSGEDDALCCPKCGYAALPQAAVTRGPANPCLVSGADDVPLPERFPTPGVTTIEALAQPPYGIAADRQIKTLVYRAGDQLVLALVRGDDQLSEPKLAAALGTRALRAADDEEIFAALGAHPGSLGGVGVEHLPIYADSSLRGACDMTTGANEDGFHLRHVCVERDIRVSHWVDLRTAQAGEACGQCGTPLDRRTGMILGWLTGPDTTLSERLEKAYTDESGQRRPLTIWRAGLDLGRCLQAVLEVHHDPYGIVWPGALAPFDVGITALDVAADGPVMQWAEQCYEALTAAGFAVLLDDRDERPGVKFKDADLIGLPWRVSLGERSLAQGEVEIKPRTGQKVAVPLDQAVERLKVLLTQARAAGHEPGS